MAAEESLGKQFPAPAPKTKVFESGRVAHGGKMVGRVAEEVPWKLGPGSGHYKWNAIPSGGDRLPDRHRSKSAAADALVQHHLAREAKRKK